ncbi:hypothetical protein [Novosphingobium sp.]|uniref:hypothetical protein n=1 Tax=Novosphingobium sp. TaxID=1874826 RepID=UPI00334175B9
MTTPTAPPAAPDPAGKPAETGFALALATQQTAPAPATRAPGALPPTMHETTPAALVAAAMPGKTLPAARPDPADAAPVRLAATTRTPAHAARERPAKAGDRSAAAAAPGTAVPADTTTMAPLAFAALPIPPLPVTTDQPGAADAARLPPGAHAAPVNPDQALAMTASPLAPGTTPDPSTATMPGVTRATGRRGAALFAPAAAIAVRSGNLPAEPGARTPGVHPVKATAAQAAAAQANAPAHHPAGDADPERPRDTGDRQTASAAAPIAPTGPVMTINPPATTATADAAPAPVPGPTDFATLVDQIARARAERHDPSSTAPVGVTMHHADFGRVSLHFSPREQGLAVTLHSADPGFAPAAAAAASGADGGTARDDRRAHDQQPGAAMPDLPAQGSPAGRGGRDPGGNTGNGSQYGNGNQTGSQPARASRVSAGTTTANTITEAAGIFA